MCVFQKHTYKTESWVHQQASCVHICYLFSTGNFQIKKAGKGGLREGRMSVLQTEAEITWHCIWED